MGLLDPAVALLDKVAESIDPNGQYRREKLLTMVAYAFISMVTLVYAFTGGVPGISNDLGANIENHVVQATGEQWFLIQNTSSSDWTNLAMQLNDDYYHSPSKPLAASGAERFFVKDFTYHYYIPRTPRVGGWTTLSTTKRPGASAPRNLQPATLTLTSDEGEFTALFQGALKQAPGDSKKEEEGGKE